jgi:large subunit ribosomal protein L9
MNVILLQDVEELGHAGEIKQVAPGHARNYLIPQGLAAPATPGALRRAELIRQARERRRKRELTDAQSLAEAISATPVAFRVKAGEKDRLYGSITSADIAQALSSALGTEVDKRKIVLSEPIKSLGTHRVAVRLMADVVPEVVVTVEREDADSEAEESEGS